MHKRFVIEAIMLAVYGELLVPSQFVEYIIPYSSLQELYEMRENEEMIMPEEEEDAHVKLKIREWIAYYEDAFNRKKIERALSNPWQKSPPLPINDKVTLTVVYAVEDAQYGEIFDPIETELILICLREKSPLLTDQPEFVDRLIETEVPIQVYDVDDFEFAVE